MLCTNFKSLIWDIETKNAMAESPLKFKKVHERATRTFITEANVVPSSILKVFPLFLLTFYENSEIQDDFIINKYGISTVYPNIIQSL